MTFPTKDLFSLLGFLDGARCVVVEHVALPRDWGIVAISAWNGSATVNEAIVGPTGFQPIECWTNYTLPNLPAHQLEDLLRESLHELAQPEATA